MEPVLINQVTATGIAEGRIAVVLRRWDAPRAKAGGTQRTPAGTIRIEHVAEHSGTYRVTRTQAVAAGFPDAKSAQAELDRRPAAHTYVITVSYLARRTTRPGRLGPGVHGRSRNGLEPPRAVGCRQFRRTVDAAVPGADRSQRGRAGAGARGDGRPGDRTIQAARPSTQGPRPDDQPRSGVSDLTPRQGLSRGLSVPPAIRRPR
jgi:hypothetical protein